MGKQPMATHLDLDADLMQVVNGVALPGMCIPGAPLVVAAVPAAVCMEVEARWERAANIGKLH